MNNEKYDKEFEKLWVDGGGGQCGKDACKRFYLAACACRGEEKRELDEEKTALVRVLEKAWAFIQDLSKSNPGYLSKLALQDYKNYNEVLCEVPDILAVCKQQAKN